MGLVRRINYRQRVLNKTKIVFAISPESQDFQMPFPMVNGVIQTQIYQADECVNLPGVGDCISLFVLINGVSTMCPFYVTDVHQAIPHKRVISLNTHTHPYFVVFIEPGFDVHAALKSASPSDATKQQGRVVSLADRKKN